jgi:acyl-CoA thioester hydrolase
MVAMAHTYRHELRIRYGEVDVQGHVFNAHYLAFVADAFDQWLRGAVGDYVAQGFDMVVKRAELTWSGGARFGEVLAVDVGVRRWGTTSFDVGYQGSVGERPIFDATLTYISVTPGTTDPVPVPDAVRAALG